MKVVLLSGGEAEHQKQKRLSERKPKAQCEVSVKVVLLSGGEAEY